MDDDDVDIYSGIEQLLEVTTDNCQRDDPAQLNEGSLSPNLQYILETNPLPPTFNYDTKLEYHTVVEQQPDEATCSRPGANFEETDSSKLDVMSPKDNSGSFTDTNIFKFEETDSRKLDVMSPKEGSGSFLDTNFANFGERGSSRLAVRSPKDDSGSFTGTHNSEQNAIGCNLNAIHDSGVESEPRTEGPVVEQAVSVAQLNAQLKTNVSQESIGSSKLPCALLCKLIGKPVAAYTDEMVVVDSNVSSPNNDETNTDHGNSKVDHCDRNNSDANKSGPQQHARARKRSADQLDVSDNLEENDDTAPPDAKLHLLEQYSLDRFTANSGRQIVKSLEYDVLDDLDLSNDGYYDNEEYPENSSDSEYDEIPEDEIDAMLEEGLGAYLPPKEKRRGDGEAQQELDEDDLSHEEREKVVLKARGHDHFEVLPEGWLEVTHNSGMPVYLHKQFRVCTLSKPYFLGPGSARKHEIPITAIPCYHYRYERAKEAGALNKMLDGKNTDLPLPACDEVSNSMDVADEAKLPSAKIETVVDNNKEKSLDFLRVREYCQKLFEFQTITVRRFKTWAGRRKHQKLIKNLQRPTLPLGTKLITCPLPPSADKDEPVPTKPRREFTMNPNGKSHVCILHEYVQHAMRVQPKYIFKELENAKKPYGATVIISDMEYGTGFGSSKKQAKSEAAKATLEILIPQMKEVNPEHKASANEQQDLEFFDEVRVEDPRVSELCAKAGQPSPYQILLECLKRNYGMGDTHIKLEMNTLKHQKNEFTMTVGKHMAKVICKNKRDGKQRASQAILQKLHRHIMSWGSLLRLYGKGSCKTLKEKKQEEQQITELQSRASANRPNQSILNKLREEMIKLKTKQESVKPIGKFMPEDVDLPTSSGSNLKNVDL